MARIAMKDRTLPDVYFEELLPTIEAGIHSRPNRVRDAMNSALIAIGIRNEKLQERAFAPPQTSVRWRLTTGQPGASRRTPPTYILKTVNRKSRR